MQRIFIAINLPPEIKDILETKKQELQNIFPSHCIKWVEKDNLHVTLAFLGMMRKENIEGIKSDLATIKADPFYFSLGEISYIPPDRRKAKMIWAKGESKELTDMHKDMEKKLVSSSFVSYIPDKRGFTPHITLGRIKQWEWRRLGLSQIPFLEENIEASFQVDSFELIESKLQKSGPTYSIVAKFPFNL